MTPYYLQPNSMPPSPFTGLMNPQTSMTMQPSQPNALYQPQAMPIGNVQYQAPSGPNIADFAKLLNPGIRDVGWSGHEVNAQGQDPTSPFNDGFFKTDAQRNAIIAGRNVQGSYGAVGVPTNPGMAPSMALPAGGYMHTPMGGLVSSPMNQDGSPGIFTNHSMMSPMTMPLHPLVHAALMSHLMNYAGAQSA